MDESVEVTKITTITWGDKCDLPLMKVMLKLVKNGITDACSTAEC